MMAANKRREPPTLTTVTCKTCSCLPAVYAVVRILDVKAIDSWSAKHSHHADNANQQQVRSKLALMPRYMAQGTKLAYQKEHRMAVLFSIV